MSGIKIKPQTLKGFRDFLPETAIVRNTIIGKIKTVFEKYGYDPIETPAVEYAETLLGKYGNEANKLLYLFKDKGERNVGLRFDQTVPLARVVTQYPDIPKPFKRYQIQPVWRAENPQSGRYREFMQCDIDIIGSISPLADAEIIACSLNVTKELGLKTEMWINDRTIFDNLGLKKEEIIILDKLDKLGKESVIQELVQNGRKNAEQIFQKLQNSEPTPKLTEIFASLESQGLNKDQDFLFTPFLARGLEYYTSTIFELKVSNNYLLSIAGGGRYDNLIGLFIGTDTPAVGIAFGFDRLIDVLTQKNPTLVKKSITKVLITIFSKDFLSNSLKISSNLRTSGINTEIYLDLTAKLDKQLKYADKKGIPYVVIIGPDEVAKGTVQLKNLQTKEQKEIPENVIPDLIRNL